MSNRRLLTSQKNEILRISLDMGVDPRSLVWSDVYSERSISRGGEECDMVSRLQHKGTHYYFLFDFAGTEVCSEFCPGGDQIVEVRRGTSWIERFLHLDQWLTHLKRELAEPDLWAQLDAYELPEPGTLIAGLSNEMFTSSEIDQIALGIQSIKDYLTTHSNLTGQHQSLLEDKLGYLMEAARRQGRRDWFFLALGVIFMLAVELALSPRQANDIWGMLTRAVSGLLRLLP